MESEQVEKIEVSVIDVNKENNVTPPVILNVSAGYVITHSILFGTLSIIMITQEISIGLLCNYLTQFFLTFSPLNITIGFYYVFIAILSLFCMRTKFHKGSQFMLSTLVLYVIGTFLSIYLIVSQWARLKMRQNIPDSISLSIQEAILNQNNSFYSFSGEHRMFIFINFLQLLFNLSFSIVLFITLTKRKRSC